jgi:uncharacterized protein (DUF2236 family)
VPTTTATAEPANRSTAEGVGPGSLIWERGGDWRALLVGGRSLLLQVAHPVVAAGVSEHSDFAADPWGRLMGTLELYVGGVIFGWPDGPAAAGARLREMHKSIKGVDAAGRRYHALQPDAYAWVHATLVEGFVALEDQFGRPFRPAELARLYDEMREVGRLYGLRDRDMAPDWPSFQAYFEEMVRIELEDNATVREVLHALTHTPPPPELPIPEIFWSGIRPAAGHVGEITTVGLLPVPLRERLGLRWTRNQERELRALAALVRRSTPLLPERARLLPWAYNAKRRARRAAA